MAEQPLHLPVSPDKEEIPNPCPQHAGGAHVRAAHRGAKLASLGSSVSSYRAAGPPWCGRHGSWFPVPAELFEPAATGEQPSVEEELLELGGAGLCTTHCQAATFLVWHLQACAYCKVACKSRALQQILTAYMVRTCQNAATKRGTRRVTPLDPPCHSTSTSRAAGSFSTTLRLCFQDRRHLQQHRPLPGPHPGKDCSDRRPPGTQKILDIFI